MRNDLDEAYRQTDLQYDKLWLDNNLIFINQERQYTDDLYKKCYQLIDLFCLQQLKEIAYKMSEDGIVDIEPRLYDYLAVIDYYKVDFNFFVLLAGEKYIRSNSYDPDIEDDDEKKAYLLYYLISEQYSTVLQYLMQHYVNEQKFLLNILESLGIDEEYRRAIREITTLEDMFDHPDTVQLHEWASNGFDITGDQ